MKLPEGTRLGHQNPNLTEQNQLYLICEGKYRNPKCHKDIALIMDNGRSNLPFRLLNSEVLKIFEAQGWEIYDNRGYCSECKSLKPAPPSVTPPLEDICQQVATWSNKTFGKRSYTAPLHHMKKEIDEALVEGKLSEYTDCLLCLLDSFRTKYPELHTDDLLRASRQKLEIVEQTYIWGEPDENGDYQHITSTCCVHNYNIEDAGGVIARNYCDADWGIDIKTKGKPCVYPDCNRIKLKNK